jgi:hypothetical protein
MKEQPTQPIKNREAVADFTPSAFYFVFGCCTHYKKYQPYRLIIMLFADLTHFAFFATKKMARTCSSLPLICCSSYSVAKF